MRLKSEIILQDIKYALSKHNDSLQAEGFRVSWFAIVGLLRSVGHVLDKVDSVEHPQLQSIIKKKFQNLKQEKPNPRIFWEFIDSERNRFLKEYEHSVDRGVTVGPIKADGDDIYIVIDHGNASGGYARTEDAPFHSIISSGFYKGRNEKELAQEALDWWKKYIDEIKSEGNF